MADSSTTPPAGFVAAGAASDLPAGSRRRVALASGVEVTVLNVAGRFYAIESVCPHSNGPLGDGPVVGDHIRCPLHLWKFDLRDGSTIIDRRVRAKIHEVRIEGGAVLVADAPIPAPSGTGRRGRFR
jgi:nitrite reductase/ring-hydroxylating ferredoxin subunit